MQPSIKWLVDNQTFKLFYAQTLQVHTNYMLLGYALRG